MACTTINKIYILLQHEKECSHVEMVLRSDPSIWQKTTILRLLLATGVQGQPGQQTGLEYKRNPQNHVLGKGSLQSNKEKRSAFPSPNVFFCGAEGRSNSGNIQHTYQASVLPLRWTHNLQPNTYSFTISIFLGVLLLQRHKCSAFPQTLKYLEIQHVSLFFIRKLL